MNNNRYPQARRWALALSLSVFLAGQGPLPIGESQASEKGKMVPLELDLPAAAYAGTPKELPPDTTALKPDGKPRPPFLVPEGVTNVAEGKPVTSSDPNPITGELALITDGEKESFNENIVILRRRTQWVQVDLGKPFELHAVLLWHEHKAAMVYRDVIVQVADDPDFIEGVRTLFNNDQDNSSGIGIGTDREYFESYEGKLIDPKGVTARYLRCYSKGSTDSALNCYTELEVYGLPAK